MRKSELERLIADKHFPIIEAIVAHLRGRSPQLVPTGEIAHVVGRSSGQVYGFVKKGRRFLFLTTGEFITNVAKRKGRSLHGYTVTKDYRAAEFEATKSFDRADGHLASGITTHSRVPIGELKTNEDIQLWIAINTRSISAKAFRETSEVSRQVAALKSNNKRLSAASQSDTVTPWETLGLENPRAVDNDDDDIS